MLVSKAGVLVENLSPGTTVCLGPSYNEWKFKYPSFVVWDISGYGDHTKTRRADYLSNAKVSSMDGVVWDREHLRARGRRVEVETPRGLVPALLPPGIGRASSVNMDEVPEAGQHNESILAELGMWVSCRSGMIDA
ncbi:hypothetical protein F4775DRAFT_24793 [Biscogniauxia sp. FL1348]|nr:hypothetical protein F4775DRAFT_24793 [Biscogniauxia sp. FL1348]